ncbi:PREDICTED: polycystic kidney disease and receptor for egg jelly-related protein, partial [Condylura cristata]|uniref:polycystic kidney disease and receptor for egg jelly-related protein n=1 Tax=Condylura cristata TaxID=143302 RepID=UPI000642CD77
STSLVFDASGHAVACQESCVISQVKINTGQWGSPVQVTKKTEVTLQVATSFQCAVPHSLTQLWRVYSVPAVGAVPDWKKTLPVTNLVIDQNSLSVRVPKHALDWGVYLFNFSVSITVQSGTGPPLSKSDAVYVVVGKSPLRAVLLGDPNTTISFVERLVLNGSTSSDPDADDPAEGLHFFWYCTTNEANFQRDKVAVRSAEVCVARQAASLQWRTPPTSALTLPPQTLKGNLAYFFRMAVEKGDRTAFADKRVNVLRGLAPKACIACIENCDTVLVTSERFSLFVNCTGCTSSDVYRWSIRTQAGQEVPFDWGVRTTTGRDSEYLHFKALAFQGFTESTFWVSAHVVAWSGWDLVFRHAFVVNHIPRVGECKVTPPRGVALVTKFVVRCDNFHDLNMPLTYKIVIADLFGFAEISSLKENNLGIILHLGTKSSSRPSFFPVGPKANHFAMRLYAQVYDVLGAFSRVTFSAAVPPPTEGASSETLLQQLVNFTSGPGSVLATHLQRREYLAAGYFTYVIASVLNSLKDEPALQAGKAQLREHLVNQTFLLPMRSLVEISQVVMVLTKLTQKGSGLTTLARRLATLRLWQSNEALGPFQHNTTSTHSEQIETVCTGVLTGLSNILQLPSRRELIERPLHLIETLADTVLAGKVPGNETTVLRSSSLKMYVRKMEAWQVGEVCTQGAGRGSCFRPTVNASAVPLLPAGAPVSAMFCEFAKNPFPWLSFRQNSSAQVVGMRVTGRDAKGAVVEVAPEVAEVFLALGDVNRTTFNLTMSPDNGTRPSDRSAGRTMGAFRVEVDCRTPKELLVQVITPVTLLFTASVFAGDQMEPDALVATFLVPHDLPPVANRSDLFDPSCVVKQARVLCLPPSLLDVIAQRSLSAECSLVVLLEAPRFLLSPSDKLVRVSVFRAYCMDMVGVQSEWRDYACALGEMTTLDRVHCVRRRRSLSRLVLHTRYLTAKMIVAPNPVDLRLVTVKKITQNPVALFTVLFLLVMYIILAFWALHRDETDQFLRQYVIVLPDNDPYDHVCYLVTVFTGSRCGAGTGANVFLQLLGTQGDSSVHCLSHPSIAALYRGSINSFLLATRSDLGDVRAVRVWHDNEGDEPSWYLSRIKVENLFSRHIWLFMCRAWLSVDTAVDRVFHAMPPDQPLRKKDFFLIDMSHSLGRNHLWFSVFLGVIAKPFNRLQRLSCCLAMLMASLLCNIMFFNLSKEDDSEYEGGQYVRAMMIGLESAVITLPVQLAITFLFTCSQRQPQVALEAVTPQAYPWLLEEGGHWEDHLEKWHSQQAGEEPPKGAKRARRARVARGAKGEAKGAPQGAEAPRKPAPKKAPPERRWPFGTPGLLHAYGSGGYAFHFFPEQQQFNSSLRLAALQSSSWLDDRTWAVIVELTTFNADVSLFCCVSVVFEVSELGVVNSSVSVHAFALADFDRRTSAEVYLYAAILLFFVAYTLDEGYVVAQQRAAYLRSPYNQLNLALKCIFALLVVLFLAKHFVAAGVVAFHMAHPSEFAPFHAVARLDRLLRVALGFLLLLTTLKTLRYSRLFYDVRLAQRAVQTALPGICHMAAVVAVYLFVYVAFGYLVFGQHEWSYCSLAHAAQTVFSYCVSAFRDTAFADSRGLGVLFLSSFLLVMVCVLLNLFQAVILSAYEDMKQPVYEEPSDEAEAVSFLCRRLRTALGFLSPSRPPGEPDFVVDMLYGQPRQSARRYLGLKTRSINGKKMVYLVV